MGSETIVLDWEIEGIVFVYIPIYTKLSQNRFFSSLIKKEQNIWNPVQRKTTEQIQEVKEMFPILLRLVRVTLVDPLATFHGYGYR